MIDHAWAVALNRAQKAGILLAHILMSGAHGDRPVTLTGYSMGARLIFHCLPRALPPQRQRSGLSLLFAYQSLLAGAISGMYHTIQMRWRRFVCHTPYLSCAAWHT